MQACGLLGPRMDLDQRYPPEEGTPSASFAANCEFTYTLSLADREKDRGFIERIVSGKFHNQAVAGQLEVIHRSSACHWPLPDLC